MRPAQKVLHTARRSARRQDYSSSTKRALIKNATVLFTDHGYAGTSLDEIVAAARVTKGAFYHHFPSKLALFESVFQRTLESSVRQIEKELRTSRDPWKRAQIGLRGFLAACQEPTYRRICMQEAPVALGHDRWQEAESDSSFRLIQGIVADLLKDLGDEEHLTETFTTVFYGAIKASGELVADATDQEEASRNVQAVIVSILAGMRLLEQTGTEISDIDLDDVDGDDAEPD